MRKLLDYFSLHFLRKIEIRYRLISSFILVSLLPLLISGVISYRETTRATQEKVRVFSIQIVNQISQNLRLQMEKIEAASEELGVSDRLQSQLTDYYSEDQATSVAARTALTRVLLESYGSFSYINQKYLLDREHQMVDTQVFPQLAKSVEQLVKAVPAGGYSPHWQSYNSAPGQKSIVMLRPIRFIANNRPAGTLFVGIKPSHFSGIFDSVNLGYDSNIFVLDRNNGEVVIRGSERTGDPIPGVADPNLMHSIGASLAQSRSDNFATYTARGNIAYVAAFAEIPNTSWLVVSVTPRDKLNAEVLSVRETMVYIGLLCFIASLLLSYLISRSISQPLRKLMYIIKETERGNYKLRLEQDGSDEIAVLSRKFNDMSGSVRQHKEQLEEQVAERTRDLELANRKLEELSTTDGLTGVANRRRFDDALATELRRATRAQTPVALLMLDVDFFKKYNDRYGHQDGDECLRTVARLLQTTARRASDLVARYGGEEFALILADSDVATAVQHAEHICAAIAALRIPHAGSPFAYVTASIGVAVVLPDEHMTPERLLRSADQALYHAKYQGRNRMVVGEDDPLQSKLEI
ncbi:diguanylate cyclase [Herbaspirillum lusitanum]|jgi:diguanylate cyclase (GGDEF)-like protein|uniref:diguanylate cyclase n=1 Tax=Herbaspirillum lusitanum TaxID=213312 RepID=A0ABW9A4K4_9BURK